MPLNPEQFARADHIARDIVRRHPDQDFNVMRRAALEYIEWLNTRNSHHPLTTPTTTDDEDIF